MEMLDSFIRYLQFEKRFSDHTVKAYSSDLIQFKTFLQDEYELDDMLHATTTQIRTWMVTLIQGGLSIRSALRKRSVLNAFYSFAIRQQQLEENPADSIAIPSFQKKLPNYLRPNEWELLQKLLPGLADFRDARDTCIINLLFATGIRRSELIGVEISDLDLNARTLRVLGKRNKERIVPLIDELTSMLGQYVEIRLNVKSESKKLFLTDKFKPLYPKFVYNLVRRYIVQVTKSENAGPHMLRHTFATMMLDNGADINAIKSILGHADLNATQVYTHTSIEKLKRSYSQAHPKASEDR